MAGLANQKKPTIWATLNYGGDGTADEWDVGVESEEAVGAFKTFHDGLKAAAGDKTSVGYFEARLFSQIEKHVTGNNAKLPDVKDDYTFYLGLIDDEELWEKLVKYEIKNLYIPENPPNRESGIGDDKEFDYTKYCKDKNNRRIPVYKFKEFNDLKLKFPKDAARYADIDEAFKPKNKSDKAVKFIQSLIDTDNPIVVVITEYTENPEAINIFNSGLASMNITQTGNPKDMIAYISTNYSTTDRDTVTIDGIQIQGIHLPSKDAAKAYKEYNKDWQGVRIGDFNYRVVNDETDPIFAPIFLSDNGVQDDERKIRSYRGTQSSKVGELVKGRKQYLLMKPEHKQMVCCVCMLDKYGTIVRVIGEPVQAPTPAQPFDHYPIIWFPNEETAVSFFEKEDEKREATGKTTLGGKRTRRKRNRKTRRRKRSRRGRK